MVGIIGNNMQDNTAVNAASYRSPLFLEIQRSQCKHRENGLIQNTRTIATGQAWRKQTK